MDLICGIVDFHKTPDITNIIRMTKNFPERFIISDDFSAFCFDASTNTQGNLTAIYNTNEKTFFLESSKDKEFFYAFSGSCLMFSSRASIMKNRFAFLPSGKKAMFSKKGLEIY